MPSVYLPFPKSILSKVFENPKKNQLVHPGWNIARIGFQPFPFPSATRFIIDRMRQTLVEGDTLFIKKLDTHKAAGNLVDDTFVMKTLDEMGGISRFCNYGSHLRRGQEEIYRTILR